MESQVKIISEIGLLTILPHRWPGVGGTKHVSPIPLFFYFLIIISTLPIPIECYIHIWQIDAT